MRAGPLAVCLALTALASGCGGGSGSEAPGAGRPLHRERAREALLAQAEQLRRAVLRGDHGRLADLTHPAVLAGLGGRAGFTRRMDEIGAEMRAKGYGVADVTLSDPSELVESGGA